MEVEAMIAGKPQVSPRGREEVAQLLPRMCCTDSATCLAGDCSQHSECYGPTAGVVTQFPPGRRVPSCRPTQDLSFLDVRESVKQRIDMSAYVEMIYGWCLPKDSLYYRRPPFGTPDTAMKYDYSDVYRRVAHSPTAAAQSIIIFAGWPT
jgi:hypothetical protein